MIEPGVGAMMNLDTAAGRLPLVLVVDAAVSSRHVLWRTLHRAFGVLEADAVASARTWLVRRPDIDALVVHGDLPDGSGEELAREWLDLHPASKRVAILATQSVEPGLGVAPRTGSGPFNLRVEHGDLRGVVEGLATWLSSRDASSTRLLLRDADRLLA
jgi:hypothetical protein